MQRSISNYNALGKVQGEGPMLKALVGAIGFDLSAPDLAIELMGPRVSQLGKSVRVFAANDPRLPTNDQIKAFLGRKWTVPSDTPALADVAGRVESFFHTNMPEIDLGWMNIFRLVDLRSSQHDSFDITDTNAGIVWEQQKPGAKIKPRREIVESSTSVKYLTYVAGLGLLDDWLRFQKFWKIEEAILEFRATAWDKKAELHYALLTAQGAGIDQAFDTNDTKTFNNAASAILRNVRTKGYAAGQNARFWIVCAPEHQGRIQLMLEATQGSGIVQYQAGVQPIAYSVEGVIASTHIPANSTGYYLVLPGRKIARGEWLDLQTKSVRDEYTRAEDLLGTMQFNAIVGDSDQIRRVKFA